LTFRHPFAAFQRGRCISKPETFRHGDFAEGQQFKISPKAIDLIRNLPGAQPGKTAPALSKEMEKSQRTIERYLEDLDSYFFIAANNRLWRNCLGFV
jgi:hypothetical protein